ncbi:MAG: hypothetical protein ACI9VR_004516 [Cognaticolwellia sp.]|jgi:hypothetical protein
MAPCKTLTLLTLLLAPSLALAEGTSELGVYQALRSGTVLQVDILDSSVESMTWTGTGSVTVTDPSGTSLGRFASGDVIPASGGDGAYKLVIGSSQSISSGWDVAVNGAVDSGGRLWSTNWQFNAGSYAAARAVTGSFYAAMPDGSGSTAVLEMQTNGLSGYVYNVSANRYGVDGDNGGKSISKSDGVMNPEFQIYLNPPSDADYQSATPMAEGFWLNGGAQTSVVDGSLTECDQVDSGVSGLAFFFESDRTGTYQIQCDLDQDGSFSRTGGSSDLLLIGGSASGWNTVAWDGLDNTGATIPVGSYDCLLEVHGGEFHYVAYDIETSFEGLRLYELDSSYNRTALDMYWDDSAIQSNTVTMTDGQTSLESSGESGISSGAYTDTASANVNARAWGAWVYNGKGNNAYLDTYSWLDADSTLTIEFSSSDSSVDTDGDGISDYEELCWYGSDPDIADTNGDGVNDGTEYGSGASSTGLGGLEASRYLAEALAQRALVHQRTDLDITQIMPTSLGDSDMDVAPASGPLDSLPIERTPTDLLTLTNATDVRGWDYEYEGRILGSIILLETWGERYNHTKPTCDRVKGAVLQPPVLRSFGEQGQAIIATHRFPGGERESALTLTLYDQGDHWSAETGWVPEDFSEPAHTQRVLTLQVWAITENEALTLAQDTVHAIGSFQPIRWETQSQAPAGVIRSTQTLGGRMELLARNNSQDPLDVFALVSDADGELEQWLGVVLPQSSARFAPRFEPFAEASLTLVGPQGIEDRTWLFDGSWTVLHEGLFSGKGSLEYFETQGCAVDWSNFAAFAEGLNIDPEHVRVDRLFGCALASTQDSPWLSVARHMGGSAQDFSEAQSLLFWVHSAQDYKVCAESAQAGDYTCVTLPAQPDGDWVALPLSAFATADAKVWAQVNALTFTVEGGQSMELEIAALAVTEFSVPDLPTDSTPEVSADNSPEPEPEPLQSGGGCSTTSSGSSWLLTLAIAMVAVLGRRED